MSIGEAGRSDTDGVSLRSILARDIVYRLSTRSLAATIQYSARRRTHRRTRLGFARQHSHTHTHWVSSTSPLPRARCPLVLRRTTKLHRGTVAIIPCRVGNTSRRTVVRPRRFASMKCGLTVTDVWWPACLLVTSASCAKTAEPIQMSFGL